MSLRSYLYGILCSFLVASTLTAQSIDEYLSNRGEAYIAFRVPNQKILHELSRLLSIDKIIGDSVIANVNKEEFMKFQNYALPYQHIITNNKGIPTGKPLKSTTNTWDYYPTYEEYVAMMQGFETTYPQLCKLHSIGQSVMGRELLYLKISDNPLIKEAEPEFMYNSSMHGDELTGYVLMLRLIDYLLSNYNVDNQIKNLVDNMEIWINPLFNPDGTYYGGNNDVSQAIRRNANGVDLNRHFPDPTEGLGATLTGKQPEVQATIDFMRKHNFVLAANLHGGTSVVNYPWDTWTRLHPDNDWYVAISRRYVDEVHKVAPTWYFTGYDDGITNGADWYVITGGKQDYTNYFAHGREVTIEISDVKTPEGYELPDFWNYNQRSLIQYMEECTKGIRGQVVDSISGLPIRAKVEIIGHDADESFVYSDSLTGWYYRMVNDGTYDLKISAPGMNERYLYEVTIAGVNKIKEEGEKTNPSLFHIRYNQHNRCIEATSMEPGLKLSQAMLFQSNGIKIQEWDVNKNINSNTRFFPVNKLYNGVYLFHLRGENFSCTVKLSVVIP